MGHDIGSPCLLISGAGGSTRLPAGGGEESSLPGRERRVGYEILSQIRDRERLERLMRLLWLLLTMLVPLWVAAPALALTAGYDRFTHHLSASSLDATELKSDQEWGQTFEINFGSRTEVVLDQVTLFLFRSKNQNNKTVTASIRSSWNGAPVWESTIAANSVELDNSANANNLHQPITFFGSSVQLSTGVQYYLRLETTASVKMYAHFDSSSSYSPGHMINKDGNNESGKDLVFAVPEPSTALLLALGLIGMRFARRA